jgi:hypothetical protein
MNLKKYQNELAVLLSLLLLMGAFLYKNIKVSSSTKEASSLQHSVDEFKEIIALKRVWADKGLPKKITALKNTIPAAKVTWSKKGKKLTAVYAGLSATELNRLIMKVMNLAVQIQFLDIQKSGSSYHVELKCKW